MLVKSILNSKALGEIITIEAGATISEAAALLSKHGIGTVVVSADGVKPDGILSERDIVRQLAKVGSACLDKTVGDYMTKKVITCTSESNAEVALEAMTQGRFRHMPVVDDGKLVGLISLGDVVKAQLSEVAMEKSALEGMIMGH